MTSPSRAPRPVVVLAFLGEGLEDLARRPDLRLARLELFVGPDEHDAFAETAARLARVAPRTAVRRLDLDVDAAERRDFEALFDALLTLARRHPFSPEDEDLFVLLSTGTDVARLCLGLLTHARYVPAKLLLLSGVGTGDVDWSAIDVDRAHSARLRRGLVEERNGATGLLRSGFPTTNAGYEALLVRLAHVARRTRAPLLLVGPAGAGKSLLARRIHELGSGRAGRSAPFVAARGARLRGAEIEAAVARARGGTLVLDEVSELGLDEQARLVDAIEALAALEDEAGPGPDAPAAQGARVVATTRAALAREVERGRFRDDLLAHLATWTFHVPSLAARRADLAPNLDLELARAGAAVGVSATLTAAAREAYLAWATSDEATWPANFRDLGASAQRMATLAPGGRVDEDVVHEELATLRASFAARAGAGAAEAGRGEGDERAGGGTTRGARGAEDAAARVLGPAKADALDRFDRVQLSDVLEVCLRARSLSDAGRTLFAASRRAKANPNDADRLRKYLARYGLDLDAVRARARR